MEKQSLIKIIKSNNYIQYKSIRSKCTLCKFFFTRCYKNNNLYYCYGCLPRPRNII